MDRRAFVAAMASMFVRVAGVGLARTSDEDRPLARRYTMTTALVLKYYPDAKTELTQHTIRFEARTPASWSTSSSRPANGADG